ncbi:MAG: hypothetical protein R3332_13210 [Pseudohongiellaceae bacterium]|nr:hypothetical protein [Pseudohongiellaceae bacterium]
MLKQVSLTMGLIIGLAVANVTTAQNSNYSPTYPAGMFKTEVPVTFSPCANDFGTCSINMDQVGIHGLVSVFYGAEGKYAVFSGRGDFTCSPAAFGISDPVENVKKACWIFAGFVGNVTAAGSPNTTTLTALPAGVRSCGVDFGECEVSGMWTGVYGVNDTYKNIAGSGNFECSPAGIGMADPMQGVQKTCYVKPVQFGSFTLNEVTPLLTTLVPGISVLYSLDVEVGATELWSTSWRNISNGQTIGHLPNLTSYSLGVSFRNCPGYSIYAYGHTSQGCNMGISLPEDQSRMTIDEAVTGRISFSVRDNVIYPSLSY